jgi:hypothetical protein
MMNGEPWSGQGRLIFIPAAQNNIFLGDPLVPIAGSDAFGVPAYGIATAGASAFIAGGFLGNSNGPAGSGFTLLQNSPVYSVGGVDRYGFICDDPNILFEVQEDSVGGAIAASVASFSNGNLIAGAGSTITGFSGWMLDSSTVTNTANATYQVKLVGLQRGPDNALGNYAKWQVRLNLAALWNPAGV